MGECLLALEFKQSALITCFGFKDSVVRTSHKDLRVCIFWKPWKKRWNGAGAGLSLNATKRGVTRLAAQNPKFENCLSRRLETWSVAVGRGKRNRDWWKMETFHLFGKLVGHGKGKLSVWDLFEAPLLERLQDAAWAEVKLSNKAKVCKAWLSLRICWTFDRKCHWYIIGTVWWPFGIPSISDTRWSETNVRHSHVYLYIMM